MITAATLEAAAAETQAYELELESAPEFKAETGLN